MKTLDRPDQEVTVLGVAPRHDDVEVLIARADSSGLDYWATWSPDGRMIAFTRDVDLDEEKKQYTNTDLHILDVTSGETRNITNDDTLNMQPAWRP